MEFGDSHGVGVHVSSLRSGADAHVRRSGHVSTMRELRSRRRARSAGGALPASGLGVRRVPARTASAHVVGEQIFTDYAYFSSYSDSWVAHGKRYADEMIRALGLSAASLFTEWPATTGTCCSISVPLEFLCLASSLRAMSLKPLWRKASRRRSASSAWTADQR